MWSVGEWGGSGGVVAGLTERRTMVAIHVGTVVMALWLVRDGGQLCFSGSAPAACKCAERLLYNTSVAELPEAVT